jgi:hypothetical protein
MAQATNEESSYHRPYPSCTIRMCIISMLVYATTYTRENIWLWIDRATRMITNASSAKLKQE